MKKLLTALAFSLLLSTPMLFADTNFIKNMAHSNPVPNYMSIIKANFDKLALNADQKEKVMVWKKKNGPKMAAMVNSVVKGEAEIAVASMDGVSQADINVMAEKLMDTRMKIIAGKTTCRDYMMKVLSKEQWKKLTDTIKAS